MSGNDRYMIRSVVHAATVLGSFRTTTEVMSLADVTRRTGLKKALVFRMLHTLRVCGMVDRLGAHGYRSRVAGTLPHRPM